MVFSLSAVKTGLHLPGRLLLLSFCKKGPPHLWEKVLKQAQTYNFSKAILPCEQIENDSKNAILGGKTLF